MRSTSYIYLRVSPCRSSWIKCNNKEGGLKQDQLPILRKVRAGILGSVQGRSYKCLKQKLKAYYCKSSFKLKTRFIIKLSSGSIKEGRTAAYIDYKFFNRLNYLIIAIIPFNRFNYLIIAIIHFNRFNYANIAIILASSPYTGCAHCATLYNLQLLWRGIVIQLQ